MDEMLIDSIMGSKIVWESERIRTLADIRTRHIGRVVTATVFMTDNQLDYSSFDVMGTFEGFTGDRIIVSGELYGWDSVRDFKIWRKRVNNG